MSAEVRPVRKRATASGAVMARLGSRDTTRVVTSPIARRNSVHENGVAARVGALLNCRS